MPQNWMIVERLENWEADSATNFQMFGISSRYRRLISKIRTGDLVFAYVSSRISAFADVREVKGKGASPVLGRTYYNKAFDYRIDTAPRLVLPREHWLSIDDVKESLELTKGRKQWQPLFQTSIRELSSADGKLLFEKLRANHKAHTR